MIDIDYHSILAGLDCDKQVCPDATVMITQKKEKVKKEIVNSEFRIVKEIHWLLRRLWLLSAELGKRKVINHE